MSITGLSYNLRLIPGAFSHVNFLKIRDIPGSKTILIALAWGVVTAILPSLSASGNIRLTTVLVSLWSICLVFVRTAFFDILDIQGDRIVGKTTIPLVFGEKQTMRFLKWLLIGVIAVFTLSTALRIIPGLGFALVVCPIFLFVILSAHENGYMLPGIRLEFLVESQFVLAGIITLLWSVVT
ncbi:MAG: UbiA family prenyltransferase [bacterium]|nr:UbiA family prenyltransferase [bacterium]